MAKRKRYYMTQDRNGTEDEITIRSPRGKDLAFIWFWDEKGEDNPGKEDADRAKAGARLIVDALNAYDPIGEKSRNCEATLPGIIEID